MRYSWLLWCCRHWNRRTWHLLSNFLTAKTKSLMYLRVSSSRPWIHQILNKCQAFLQRNLWSTREVLLWKHLIPVHLKCYKLEDHQSLWPVRELHWTCDKQRNGAGSKLQWFTEQFFDSNVVTNPFGTLRLNVNATLIIGYFLLYALMKHKGLKLVFIEASQITPVIRYITFAPDETNKSKNFNKTFKHISTSRKFSSSIDCKVQNNLHKFSSGCN